MALHYLGMIPGSSTGPTGVLKYRIYYSGSPDIPADVPQPEYPFAEPSYQEAHQEPAATSSMGGLAQGSLPSEFKRLCAIMILTSSALIPIHQILTPAFSIVHE